MNEIEKQKYFTLTDAVNTSVISTSRDIRDIKPIKDIEAPKYKTLTDAVRGFRFNQEIIDDIQKSLTEVPEATTGQKIKAGAESWYLGLKQAPESVRNLIYRHFQGMEYPNATTRQALAIAEASAIRMNNERSLLQMRQTEEGTADSVIANLTSGALSVGEFALMGLATGGLGYALMGAQEAGDLSQEFVSKDIESGKIYEAGYKGQSLKEVIAADTYGAVAGWIEKGLGVEQSISEAWLSLAKQGAKSATKKSVGEAIVKGSIGEGLEEFLQGEASWATGKIIGKEDKDFYEGFQDSLISGVYGAILGGAFGGASTGLENGVARYYQARQDMASLLMNKGLEQKEAVQIADNTLTNAVDFITKELEGRNSLQTYFGEEWNKLVDGVEQAYISQGWEQRFPDRNVREFAEMNAKAMVAPVIELSNRTHMPLNQLLDLTRFRSNQNALFIDLPNMDDPKALRIEIKNRKAEIKRLRSMPATQATERVRRLKEQVKVLELRLNNLTSYNAIEKARMDTRKATLDNQVLASSKPEIMADLNGIRQAQRGESFVYVGNNQVPVRYVIKPMAKVQASHIAGEVNPNYTLKELQNRTRGTVTDDAILQNRAANLKPEELAESPNTQYGAPVVNKNGEVISGNGRMETLRRAYELGNTSYKEMLDKLGYNTEGIERPVLVRETIDDLTPEQQVAIAEASNVSETSAFDHARQAMNDAKLLKKGVSDPITFADELPLSERQAYIRENGQYDLLALQRRFDDAVLAWIIGDTRTFDSLVLANRLNQKVVKGISMQGGNIVEFSKSNPALGIKKDLRYALVKSASMRSRGQFIPTVQQQDIEEGITFNADALLYAMTFSNNSSELSNFIGQYVQTHQSYIDGQKDSFLADSLPKLSKEDITNQVLLNNPLTSSKFDKDGTCTDSNLKAVILNRIPVENVGYGTIKVEPEESQLFQEQFNLADENARLDEVYPEYKGETITIDGKERTVYNSNGERIAKSKQALENFYKWFGDSKVVDEQGRPLVVYHSTDVEFSVFDKTKADSSVGLPAFYFSSSEQYSREYGSITMPVYLKAENVFNIGKDVPDGWYELKTNEERVDLLKKQGYDGVFDYNAGATEYAVFEPNQIKSTSNRGTFDIGEDNIYYQPAWHGGRELEGGKFSLKYAGKQVGLAHGYGVYASAEVSPATGYRSMVDENITYKGKNIAEVERELRNAKENDKANIVLDFAYKQNKKELDREDYSKDTWKWFENEFLPNVESKGKLYEIDIPEDAQLIEEKKPFSEQTDTVKEAIKKLNNEDVNDILDDETTGEDIYGELVNYYSKKVNADDLESKTNEAQKLASQALEKVGVKGIAYYDNTDGRCFVIFNPDDVKVIQKFYQRGKANINGYFDAELKTIVIGSSFNFGTLQHEFAHFFLDRVFNLYKTGAGTPEFNEWFSQLSGILDIKADQSSLRTEQQEQFARMIESYLFNKAEFPESAKPAMQMFFDWCPKEYNELLSIGWKDDKGNYHNSVFNKESLDFFNDMYSLVPELADSPLVRTFTNETNRNGTIIPSNPEQAKEREKLIGETPVEPTTPETTQASINIQNTPDPEVEGAYKEAIEAEQARKKSPVEKFTQYVRIGRGTNTREEMDELAQNYIKSHRENAERVAFGNPIPSGYEEETGSSLGYVENNTGIDRAVLILNLMNEYAPNSPEYNQLYHNFAIYRSYASKSAGLTNDVNTNYYLKGYVEINKALTQKAALVRYGKTDNAVNLWNRDIDSFISKNIDKVYKTEPESVERDKAITQFIEDAKAMFGGDDSVLLQEEIRIKKAKDKQAFIDWANRVVKQIAKGKMPPMDEAKLMDLSVKAQKASKFIDSNNTEEAVAASQDIRAWQDFVNQKGLPESFVDKIIGTYLPSAMLSSPSTHALNAVSNFFNNVAIRAATRLHYGANVISGDVLKNEYNRLKAIYAESGHNLSEDNKPDDVSRLHGEHWQFKKPESALGYLSPMRLLGWSDFYFRAHTYVDTLARIASQDAKGDPKKALELFNEYKQMNSVNQRAKEARLQAIMTGHIAVFTNNGTLANISAGIRHYLDYINLVEIGKGGHKGLGTLIMPFAKVPANIVGMGIQAVSSPFKLLGKWTGLKKDWTIQDSIALTNFGLFSSIVGIYLMAGLDYEPPYEPPHKYDPNKPYDSVKIGGVWVSVESFGALANPLRFTFTMFDMISNGKKVEPSLIKAIEGLKNDIPFTSVEFDNDYMKRKPADWLVSATYNQLSKAVPAAVKKPIAWTNRALGLQIEQDSALKRKIARQYGLDGKQTTINDYLTYIYRGIKVDTK